MNDLIDYSKHDFIQWQAEREAMRQEIEKLGKALAFTVDWISTSDQWFGSPRDDVLSWVYGETSSK